MANKKSDKAYLYDTDLSNECDEVIELDDLELSTEHSESKINNKPKSHSYYDPKFKKYIRFIETNTEHDDNNNNRPIINYEHDLNELLNNLKYEKKLFGCCYVLQASIKYKVLYLYKSFLQFHLHILFLNILLLKD
jgi:hypothetical protein